MAANTDVIDTNVPSEPQVPDTETTPVIERWRQASPQYWVGRVRYRPSDGFFDCEQQHRKERHRITLRARRKPEAQIEAARAWLLIRRNGWEAWDFYDPPLAKYIPRYVDELVKLRGTSRRTTDQYITALESLLRRETGLDGSHKFGRAKSKDKKAERKLLREQRISFLTSKRIRRWYRDYPTQAEAAKYLFQPDVVARLPYRLKRPLPFRRNGEEVNLSELYPRPW